MTEPTPKITEVNGRGSTPEDALKDLESKVKSFPEPALLGTVFTDKWGVNLYDSEKEVVAFSKASSTPEIALSTARSPPEGLELGPVDRTEYVVSRQYARSETATPKVAGGAGMSDSYLSLTDLF